MSSEPETDHEILLYLKQAMSNHLKHHEKWEKWWFGIIAAILIASLLK